MTRTRNEKNGRYTNDRSPEDILSQMERGEIYSTNELADKVDIPYRTTKNYLDQLTETGKITKQKPNATTAIWIRDD